jgi:aerobic carbon-monoxide dehydrogenase medium subunit
MRNLVEFQHPTSVEAALALLAARPHEARPLAGGTALAFAADPKARVLVDLSRTGLQSITLGADGLHLGAMATARAVARSRAVADAGGHGLAEAAAACGSRLLQNQITVGGNVVGLYPWSDLPPMLLALGAVAHLRSAAGAREVSVEELVARHPTRQLRPGELVVEIVVPPTAPRSGSAFLMFGRTAVDYTMCDVAAALELDGSVVKAVRLAVGGLRPLPVRLRAAEATLAGKEPVAATFAAAASAAMAEVQVANDFRASREYRREVCGVLVRRALETAAKRADATRRKS